MEDCRSCGKHLEEFAELESLDNGKPVSVARVADVPLTVDMFRYMSGWATKIGGKTLPLSADTTSIPTRCASPSAWWRKSSRGIFLC